MSCHNCAFEWADACAERKMHLPSGKKPCQTCSRNNELSSGGVRDNYVNIRDALARVPVMAELEASS